MRIGYISDFMEKESWTPIIVIILFLLLISIIILLLINLGITSSVLGGMTWVRAATEAFLIILGWLKR